MCFGAPAHTQPTLSNIGQRSRLRGWTTDLERTATDILGRNAPLEIGTLVRLMEPGNLMECSGLTPNTLHTAALNALPMAWWILRTLCSFPDVPGTSTVDQAQCRAHEQTTTLSRETVSLAAGESPLIDEIAPGKPGGSWCIQASETCEVILMNDKHFIGPIDEAHGLIHVAKAPWTRILVRTSGPLDIMTPDNDLGHSKPDTVPLGHHPHMNTPDLVPPNHHPTDHINMGREVIIKVLEMVQDTQN